MPLSQNPRTVITGASSGLGRALAVELAPRRAKILIADVNEQGAEETARLVRDAGGEAFFVRCDVRNRDEVAALVGEAERTLGGVDFLVNNAGVAVSGAVGDVPLHDWEWVININLWGVIYGCHAFVPHFKAQRRGHILNVASAAGLISLPELAPYNVTKAGVVALSESLSTELTAHGVGVTVLCPSFFKTGIMNSGRAHNTVSADFVEGLMTRSKVQADGVARLALKAVDAGRLYAVPHVDGRFAWWIKRAAPELLHDILLPRMHRGIRRDPG